MKGKTGQQQISFGMIFSIILVIVFLGFAFYAIKTFLAAGDKAKAVKFLDDLQEEVTNAWENQASSETQEYILPGYVDFVCFVDFGSRSRGENSALFAELNRIGNNEENLGFYPVKYTGFESATINHINLEETTADENPLCIEARNGEVQITLKKDFGEALVTIEKP